MPQLSSRPRRLPLTALVLGLAIALAQAAAAAHLPGRSHYKAPHARVAPVVDAIADDAVWERAPWRPINHRWLGPEYDAADFQGRFKVAWGEDRLYLLVEIVDDILYDAHRDPLVQYWDDDCLEIFVDEDFSGGDHQYNHNAFAYHLSLDNQAIDIGTDGLARPYNDHVTSRWRQHGGRLLWEVSIRIYGDDYADDGKPVRARDLTVGKVLGLMLAWCDNDGSELRENFIGSEAIATGPKDRGWIDAGVFGKLILDE